MESAALSRAGLAWSRVRAGRSERAARFALGGMMAAAALLVLLAAARPSGLSPPTAGGFHGWLVGPFVGIAEAWPEDGVLASAAFSALVAAMFGCWLALLPALDYVGARAVLTAIGVLHALFLLGPPLPLTDVFNYLNYARLGAEHGVNPYVGIPALFPGDPTYDFATWHHLLSPYGPLFTLFSYALVPLGLAGGYWALKLVTVGASLGCLALLWRLAERRGTDPLWAVVFVGLNPLVLVYGVGGVHNDFLMLALVLAGVGGVLAGRPARAGAALVTAAAIKGSAALVLPFALIGASGASRARLAVAAVRGDRRRALAILLGGDRRRLLAGAAAAGAVLFAASVVAFGLHGPGLDTQSSLVTPLSPANLLGLALGQGGATAWVRVLVKVGFLVVLIVLIRRTARGADWLTSTGWAMLALVVSLTWEMPWYVLWVLPFAALGRSRSLRRAAIVLSAFLLVTLAPITGWVLTHGCHCNPVDTRTGKRNAIEIRHHLR
jgi:hypothetical protein